MGAWVVATITVYIWESVLKVVQLVTILMIKYVHYVIWDVINVHILNANYVKMDTIYLFILFSQSVLQMDII